MTLSLSGFALCYTGAVFVYRPWASEAPRGNDGDKRTIIAVETLIHLCYVLFGRSY